MKWMSFARKGEANDTKSATTVAGMAGLEPASAGVKVPCLTTWLHPCIKEQPKSEGSEPTLRPLRPEV